MDETQKFIEELRSVKFSDTKYFRDLCTEYAANHNMTVEEATSILKPICDSREPK